jgi:hypothetical protein
VKIHFNPYLNNEQPGKKYLRTAGFFSSFFHSGSPAGNIIFLIYFRQVGGGG